MNYAKDRTALLSKLYDKTLKPTPYCKKAEKSAFLEGIQDCRNIVYATTPTVFHYQQLQDTMSKLMQHPAHSYNSKERDAYRKGVLSAKSLVSTYFHTTYPPTTSC